MHPNNGRVVRNFILQALRNEDIAIYGDGTKTRSFCYVDDLINGMLKAMDTSEDSTGPVNFGNPSEFTMVEIAEKALRLTASKSEMVFKPPPQDDPKQESLIYRWRKLS